MAARCAARTFAVGWCSRGPRMARSASITKLGAPRRPSQSPEAAATCHVTISVSKDVVALIHSSNHLEVVQVVPQELPASMSLDSGMQLIWARHSQLYGTRRVAPCAHQDMGVLPVIPRTLAHSPQGHLFAVCGDGEYLIYTAEAAPQLDARGAAQEIAWGPDDAYAVWAGTLFIHSSQGRATELHLPFEVHSIHGGRLLGISGIVEGIETLRFYGWTASAESCPLLQVHGSVHNVYWSASGQYAVLAYQGHFVRFQCTASHSDDADIEFIPLHKVETKVWSATFADEMFVYVSLQGEALNIPYLLGYLPEKSALCIMVDGSVIIQPFEDWKVFPRLLGVYDATNAERKKHAVGV
ncbi:Copb2 [Symbiodinium sp. CCMP2592]|nr:Copb2 [Symbiodinium sp. CCMP2592]